MKPATGAVARLCARRVETDGREQAERDEHADDHADRDAQHVGGQHADEHRTDRQPGQRREHRRPEPSPVDRRRPALAGEHEHVHAQPEDQQQGDGVARRHHGVERRAREQREAEARRRLQRDCEQQSDDDDGDYCSTCIAPAVWPEHEIALPVRDVIERDGRERLEERDAGLRVERMLDAAVDDDHVARRERLRRTGDRHRDLTVEDHHDLLRVLVRVQRHLLAGRVGGAAQAHLLAADRVQVHAVAEFVRRHVVPGAERAVSHQMPMTSRNLDPASAWVMTLMSSSKITILPSRRGASVPAALACRARSTRSGEAGCCGTQTPTAS